MQYSARLQLFTDGAITKSPPQADNSHASRELYSIQSKPTRLHEIALQDDETGYTLYLLYMRCIYKHNALLAY